MLFALIHGLASITFRGNQLISGVAINFLASGMTVVIAQAWFGQGGRTPHAGRRRAVQRDHPALRRRAARRADPRADLFRADLGPFDAGLRRASAIVPLTWWVLYRTRFGLRLRAVGENPASVDTAGVSVVRLRYTAVLICGLLCGIAGAYLSTALQAGFGKEMTAGRGYIALAALIFAKWRPWYALWATLLFGLLAGAGAATRRDPEHRLGCSVIPVPVHSTRCPIS